MTSSHSNKKLHHDMNIPLSLTTSSTKRKHQSHKYQTRLHQLGYHGIAFCHTAYGRLKLDKDDADFALPWKDLLRQSNDEAHTTEKNEMSFGRTNSYGMKIYRRLNIVVEEVSDVSRILLHTTSNITAGGVSATQTAQSPIANLLQKYDIISLQPMNEPALQNICELLSSSSAASDGSTSGSSPSNNAHCIDILAMEYATGSRGGYGLPYKLRKDYLVKILGAGVTFELCYGTAILDPKRRQGFLRTIVDFQDNYNGIQKKHMLLNNNLQNKNKRTDTPLLFSSGSRQNYSLGTDEGALALRTMSDVESLVCSLVGDDWWKNADDGAMYRDEDDVDCGGGKQTKNKKRKVHKVVVVSAAERVLARASDRMLGVVGISRCKRKQKRGWDGRSCVVGTEKQICNDDDEDDGGSANAKGGGNLVDWLSEPLRKKSREMENNNTHRAETISKTSESETISAPEEMNKHDELGKISPSTNEIADVAKVEEKNEDSQEDEDDLEDGFIAL